MCDPILVAFVKMQPHNSKPSRENVTPSSCCFRSHWFFLFAVCQVSGLIYINIKTAKRIVGLYAYGPLDACTYYGLDNGADPIQVSRLTGTPSSRVRIIVA